MSPTWVIMPFVNNPEMTLQAVEDCLAQTVSTRVLLVDQGAAKPVRDAIDLYIDQRKDHRVLCWHYNPPLPSLSGVWNRALRFVWELGGVEALVVNNDVRVTSGMVECLSRVGERETALFISAVGVRETEWHSAPPQDDPYLWASAFHDGPMYNKGGPDFSCFLLTKAGHDKYPFDESYQPAFCEDCSNHREYMLGGDGGKIFSINLPYLHYASQTLKAYSPEEQAKFNKQYAGVIATYTRHWGGPPNLETYTRKDDPSSAREGVTNPELQRRVQAGDPAYAPHDA